jgi:hypothetical protein
MGGIVVALCEVSVSIKRIVIVALALAVSMIGCVPNRAIDTGVEEGVTTGAEGETIPRWPPVSLDPEVFFVRLGECLEERGFAVSVDPGAHTIGYRGSQIQAYKTARDECILEVDPSYLEVPPEFTDDQLAELYAYVTDQAACLAELGYPQVEVPSFDRFAGDLRGRFDPVGDLAELGVFPSDENIGTCRDRAKPLWFVP